MIYGALSNSIVLIHPHFRHVLVCVRNRKVRPATLKSGPPSTNSFPPFQRHCSTSCGPAMTRLDPLLELSHLKTNRSSLRPPNLGQRYMRRRRMPTSGISPSRPKIPPIAWPFVPSPSPSPEVHVSLGILVRFAVFTAAGTLVTGDSPTSMGIFPFGPVGIVQMEGEVSA